MSNVSGIVKDYRLILRHLRSLPSSSNKSSPIYQHVKKQFQLGKLQTNVKLTNTLRGTASSYAHMISSIRELKFLRGLDSGEKLDAREKILNTAARVGLSAPQFSDDTQDFDNLGIPIGSIKKEPLTFHEFSEHKVDQANYNKGNNNNK